MSKEAYWFSHDSNAHGDDKCVRLRRIAGWEGYGIFWAVIEKLRDAKDHKLMLDCLDDLAYELHTERAKIEILFDVGLLVKDEVSYWSESLIRRMVIKEEKRAKRSQAGKAGNYARWGKEEDASQSDRKDIANGSQGDRKTSLKKGKERKGKEGDTDTPAQPSRPPRLVDQEYMDSLTKSPGYAGIDVQREYHKMLAWLETPRGKGKSPTRARFLNWLGRCEPGNVSHISGNGSGNGSVPSQADVEALAKLRKEKPDNGEWTPEERRLYIRVHPPQPFRVD